MRRTIVVGDIHGCAIELKQLLAACDRSRTDRVISVGDLAGKGPDSLAVVRFARENGIQAVLGNHDAKVLRFLENERPHDGSPHSAIATGLPAEDARWLASLPLWIRLPAWDSLRQDVLVVHAGLMPGVPLAEQRRASFLELRSIRADGSGSSRLDGRPWGACWPGPELVVYGHDAVRGLQRHPHAYGLDTGCVYGRKLTALILPELRLVSVDARRRYAAID